MIDKQGLIEYALIEYRRDPAFSPLVDIYVNGLRDRGECVLGECLRDIFGLELPDGRVLAKVLLDLFHDQGNHQQWRRARALETGRPR